MSSILRRGCASALPCRIAQARYKVTVPKNKLTINYVRSGGPGGQSANMNNTKAKVSFVIEKAEWMPDNVKNVFRRRNTNKVSSKDEFHMDCSDTVSPIENLQGAIKKIQELVDDKFN